MKRKLMVKQDQFVPLKSISVEQVENGYLVDLYPVSINNSTNIANSRLIFATAEDVVEHISEFLGVKK